MREAQSLLNTLGYQIGDPRGEVGPRTQAAITEFQLSDGTQMSGLVSGELIARLKNRLKAEQARSTKAQ